MGNINQRVNRNSSHPNEKAHNSTQGALNHNQDAVSGTDWSGLQQMGNHALLRLAKSGHFEGEIPLRRMNPEGLRQAVITQVAQKIGMTPAIQKEDGDAVELATPTSTGTVTIEEPVEDPYDVSGATLQEVFGQLDPEEWGRCRWNVDYNYETTGGRVTSVNITLRLTIRMPRWTDGYSGASQAAQAEWQRMITALRGHENHHADIARRWAPIFKDNILGQPGGQAAAKYQQTLNRMEREQRDYDTTSRHGQTEGVSLDTTIP